MPEFRGSAAGRPTCGMCAALLLLLAGGCHPSDLLRSSDDPVARPWSEDAAALRFEYGFEGLSSLADLPSVAWMRIGTTMPENAVQLSHDVVYAGQTALRLDAIPSGQTEPVSKAYVQVADEPGRPVRLFAGDRVRLSAWFLVVGERSLQGLTLFDLESESCWRDEFGRNPSPGIRLMLSGGNDYLVVERGKIGLGHATLRQTATRFPRNRWVHVEWEVDLSPGPDGAAWILLDGEPILAAAGATLPDAATMGAALGRPDFRINEPVYYDRIQVGITANATVDPATVYVDDVRLESW